MVQRRQKFNSSLHFIETGELCMSLQGAADNGQEEYLGVGAAHTGGRDLEVKSKHVAGSWRAATHRLWLENHLQSLPRESKATW